MKYLTTDIVFDESVLNLIEDCITGKSNINQSMRLALSQILYYKFCFISKNTAIRENLKIITLETVQKISEQFKNEINSLPEN